MIPAVVSFERDVMTTLTCNIAGYYPLDVSVSWTQKTLEDEVEIPLSNVRFSSHRQSRDGTYSITSYLTITSATAQAPATYSCHVSHVALAEPISVSAQLKVQGKCQGQRGEFFILPRPPSTSSTHCRDQNLQVTPHLPVSACFPSGVLSYPSSSSCSFAFTSSAFISLPEAFGAASI